MANLRWLWRYAKQVKWMILVTTIVFLGLNLSYIGIISIQQKIIDDIFIAGNYEQLVPFMLIFSVIVIVHVLGHVVGAFAYVGPTKKLNQKISTDLMRYIHRIPINVFQKERTAKYVHHFSDDIPAISIFITTNLPIIIAELTTIFVLMYLISQANGYLVIFIFVLCFLYSGLVRYFHPQMERVSKEVQEKKSEHLVVVEEGLSSTREVLAFHQMEWEKQRYNNKYEQYFSKVMKQTRLMNKQLFSSSPLSWGMILVVLGIGGYLVLTDELSLGMFVVLYGFVKRFMDSFNELFVQVMDISKHFGYVKRVRYMMEKDTVVDGTLNLPNEIKSLQFNNVSFSYEKDLPTVLHQLCIDIPLGKKVAFVGTSGGGKSTIAQLLIRFYDPTIGEIFVNGMSLQTIKREDWQEQIDIVFQEPYLFPDTIRMNITLGKDVDDDLLITACKRVQIHDVLSNLSNGYDTEVGERGVTLSGGQRQRLALARAILHNPEILILDEATSALDLETERQVQKNIDEQRVGKTTIVIAHRLSTVENADMIFVMDKGKVAEQGSHEQLLKNGKIYRELVCSEIGKEERLGSLVL